MCIQNGFNGTRLFLFNGKDKITSDGFEDVESFRQRYIKTHITVNLSS